MRYTITIPDELCKELKRCAEFNTRSLAQEILHRIKGYNPFNEGISLRAEVGGKEISEIKEGVKEWAPEDELVRGANPMAGIVEEKPEMRGLLDGGLISKGVDNLVAPISKKVVWNHRKPRKI